MNQQAGSCTLLFGPMFSGKSSELLRLLKRAQRAGLRAILFKYVKDQRYSPDLFATHDQATAQAISAMELLPQLSLALKFDFIGIDEGQFFADLVPFCSQLLSEKKAIVVASLDSTFDMKRFGSTIELIPQADEIKKFTAVCRGCGKDAPFSKRLTDATEEQLIGGDQVYAAVCRGCHSLSVDILKERHDLYLAQLHSANVLLSSHD